MRSNVTAILVPALTLAAALGGGACALDDNEPIPNDESIAQEVTTCTVLAAGAAPQARTAVLKACSLIGTAYSWGGGHGSSPGPSYGICDASNGAPNDCNVYGLDCSGMVRYAYALAVGFDVIPGTSASQYQSDRAVKRFNTTAGLVPGDLVFFGGSAGTIHHVAMYIGAGSIVEAPFSGGFVRMVPMSGHDDFYGAIRLYNPPVNQRPRGYLDGLSCTTAAGWIQDPSSPTRSNTVHLYFDSVPHAANEHMERAVANQRRSDLCSAIGSCNHGFQAVLPLGLRDNRSHVVRAYGIDTTTGAGTQLHNSPKRITCSGALPAGVKRWVTNPASFAAWHFDLYRDAIRPSAAQYAARSYGANFPAKPKCVRAAGHPEVYIIDGNYKRHLTSAASAAAWHVDLADCEVWPAARVANVATGPSWRTRPTLAIRDGKVVAMDVALHPVASAEADEAEAPDEAADPEVGDADPATIIDDWSNLDVEALEPAQP